MLGDFSHELEHTDSRLTSLVNRVDKISRKAGGECFHISCPSPGAIYAHLYVR